MDPFRRKNSPNSKANFNCSDFKNRKDFRKEVAEADENELAVPHTGARAKPRDLKKEIKKNAFYYPNTSASFKKKNLAERNENVLPVSSQSPHLEITPQSKLEPTSDKKGNSYHISPTSLHSYDPINNCTSPRPKFLRYNPSQRIELLRRIEGEKKGDEDVRSPSSANDSSGNWEESNYEGEEVLEKDRSFYPCLVWRLVFIFGVLLTIACCMSRGSSPFEGYEGSGDNNTLKIQGNVPLNLVRTENVLGGLMGLSQMCPIIIESTCNLEEYNLVSHNVDESGEGIRSELSQKTEVFEAGFHDLFLKSNGMLYNHSVVEEKVEHDEQDQRDSGPLTEECNANKSIAGFDTVKETSNAYSSVESTLVSLVHDVFNSSSTNGNDAIYLGSLEFNETSLISHPDGDQSSPLDDKELENFEYSLNPDTELESVSSFNILSDGILRLFSILIGLSLIVVGLSSCFQKYVRRLHLNSLLESPSPSSSEFGLKEETKEKILTVVPMIEESQDKELNLSVESMSRRLNEVPLPLIHSTFELKKETVFGPPRVELLGEFSLADAGICNDDFRSNLKEMECPDSQSTHYKKSRAKKLFSPNDMLDSSPSMDSTSRRLSKKVIADKGETSDASPTPLRRSRRLRNAKALT